VSWPLPKDIDVDPYTDENGGSLLPKLGGDLYGYGGDLYADRSEFESRIPAMTFARDPQAQIKTYPFMAGRVWPRVFR
jgi:hypothetical protein